MSSTKEKLAQLKKRLEEALDQSKNDSQLEEVRIKYLGRSGELTQLMKTIKSLPLEEKREIGPLLNQLKAQSEAIFEKRKQAIFDEDLKTQENKNLNFDVTAYKPGQLLGSLHPYTYLEDRIEDIFISMGYEVLDGPELETDYYNFESLNIPPDHPARDLQDTFWLDLPGKLMRTHTSPVQIHALENKKLPLAMIAPGRCYRHENTDASHDFIFNQVEALVVGKDISLANLLATIKTTLQAIFEKEDLDIRVRTSFFPFVEPAIEVDMKCPFCKSGCSVCKGSQWIEMVGAGLVHPNVLKCAGVDPTKYSGFAFCFGSTRLAMLKGGVNDIRLLSSGKLEFLEQFKS